MQEFGLTGGIGSGKSTVATMLVERGAVLIDADEIVRELQAPGEPVFDMMVERWSSEIVRPDGTLDRAAVASIVFADDDELAALNGMVHPEVARVTEERLDGLAPEQIVVHDIPLLVAPGGELLSSRDLSHWRGIVVVDTPEDMAVDRVVASRGIGAEDVRARIDAQATRDERKAVAGFVIDNSGTLDELEDHVDACWQWMLARIAEAGGVEVST